MNGLSFTVDFFGFHIISLPGTIVLVIALAIAVLAFIVHLIRQYRPISPDERRWVMELLSLNVSPQAKAPIIKMITAYARPRRIFRILIAGGYVASNGEVTQKGEGFLKALPEKE